MRARFQTAPCSRMVPCGLALTLLLAIAPAGPRPACAADRQEQIETRARRMVGRLNLEYTGLESVKSAVEANDFAAAQRAYLRYWKRRTKPVQVWGAPYMDNTRKYASSSACLCKIVCH